jgi:hypothetical protein
MKHAELMSLKMMLSIECIGQRCSVCCELWQCAIRHITSPFVLPSILNSTMSDSHSPDAQPRLAAFSHPCRQCGKAVVFTLWRGCSRGLRLRTRTFCLPAILHEMCCDTYDRWSWAAGAHEVLVVVQLRNRVPSCSCSGEHMIQLT